MKIRAKIIVVFSFAILTGLILSQYAIIRNASKIEKESIEVIEELRKSKKENFNTEVTLALTKVRDKLISSNKENVNIYFDPVKKIQENYYVVSFYDTIAKNQLKPLIKEEFDKYYIEYKYKIGVYDCFTDSLIFDEFTSGLGKKIPLKWKHDGYYFGVYFTNMSQPEIISNSLLSTNLFLATFVILLATLFLFYLSRSILKQKQISKITYDFINNMTHELKTPISTISLSTDVLIQSHKDSKDERLIKYLSIIKTENKRLENQVERVLEIAKLDKNKINLNFKELDLHEIIETCINTFNVPIQERKGSLKQGLKAENTIISGDLTHVTNIIYNLFDNANKYSKETPQISVKTVNLNDNIEVIISDQGIGIKKEDCKEIFNKFYRVSTGDVHNVKGFGLGLYYVKQMMLKHNGNIEIESIYTKGSKFTLIFPLDKKK